MHVGHINLATSFNGTGEHFVSLVEALQRHGAKQHVLVRNVALAKRLDIVDDVIVGPVVRSAVTAYCLMPHLEVVHIHDSSGAQSGLLLALTRSIPFVLTHRGATPGRNPLTQAIYKRASAIICQNTADAEAMLDYEATLQIDVIADIVRPPASADERHANYSAAEHLQVYRRAADAWRMPALLL